MIWAVELSASAIKEPKRPPRNRQARIARAIDEMEADPMAGDVIPLKGSEWKGQFRKRVGAYRIIFTLHREGNGGFHSGNVEGVIATPAIAGSTGEFPEPHDWADLAQNVNDPAGQSGNCQ
jgi:mRNA-degrading endonuclease RelE of RelBE toxin-antitoxin system